MNTRNRNLQNIVINYPRTDPPGTPTAAPTAPDKAAQQVTCRSVDPSVEATRTEVQFVYQAETNEKAGSLPEDFLNEELPALVAGTAITLSADIVCGSSGAGSITNSSSSSSSSSSSTTATNSSSVVNGTNADQESPDQGKEESPEKGKQGDRRLGSLSDCILVLSTGPMGRLQANCTPTLDVSKSCSEYADSFFVLHTSDCSPEDVKSGSLSLIAAGVASPTFLEAVNAQSVDVVVTKLTLLEDFYAAGIASPLVATTGGLTAGGITVVTLVVLVTLALVSFLYVWRRHVVRRNRRLDDDLKSIRTSWSHPSRDDGSYLTANFNDLARRHTKLNVHKCKSALCEVCRPNLGVVHMVPVPKNAKLSAVSCDLVRNDTMDSWDNVSSLANPESVGPTPARYNEPLELEPFAELDDELQLDGQDVIISVQEVDDADGEEASHVSYVRSSHARRSEPVTLKKSISSNQVLL